MERRTFLRLGAASAAVTFGPDLWRLAYGAPARPGPGPYGPLADRPDANGLLLPDGFRSRVVAAAGEPVGAGPVPWHVFPDGGGVVPAADGGWHYVGNSEVFSPGGGGVTSIRFAPDGEILGAQPLLRGTTANCSGGATPWGTWLSCEEQPRGQVHECDPLVPGVAARAHPALGMFSHEAVAVDPDGGRLYLTEDDLIDDEVDDRNGEGEAISGGYYRFTPAAYPALDVGALEAATLGEDGAVAWVEVDPARPLSSSQPDRQPRPQPTSMFAGAEGAVYDRGHVYFTTKVNNRVWDHDIAADTITPVYDAAEHGGEGRAPLFGVDNIAKTGAGDLYVCEDGGNMEIVLISAEREVVPFLRLPDHDRRVTEVAGVSFNPAGDRLYFSSRSWSRRGPGAGITFEVSGPFRAAQTAPPSTTTTLAAVAPTSTTPAPAPAPPGGELPATGGGVAPAAGLGALVGALLLRLSRRST